MSILVIGGTGNVGRPTVEILARNGAAVRTLTRSDAKAKDLPRGVERIAGDLEKPETLAAAFDGVSALFLITANGETETQRGLNALAAARNAGVKRIVFLSVQNPTAAVPHFQTKLPIEQAIRDSGAAYTILRPNFFFQTDAGVLRVIKEFGVYPMPVGNVGQNRIDSRDIADAAVRALTEGLGQDIVLHGPETFTGEQVAAVYSKYAGKPVRYAGDDLNAWEGSVKAFLPPWLLNSLKVMFAQMQKQGNVADAAAVAASRAAVGHDLRRFDDFAKALLA